MSLPAGHPSTSRGAGEHIPYGRQQITEEDVQAVVEVLRSDWLTTGPKVEAFEQAVADRVGAKHGVSFSSGTAALHGAAHAAGLGPGDEAITTPLTFCATANCVLYCGATPVFADVKDDTLTLDPDEVERKVTPKTRALLPVDYAGHPADLDELMELADRNGLTVIEDACHALGAVYKGRPVGSVAHMTVFSFHPVKHVACGEGGMVTTNDPRLARSLRLFRNHGMTRSARERQSGAWRYDVERLGFNYRLSDIASALGLSQLARLGANIEKRASIAEHYQDEFRSLTDLRLPRQAEIVRSAWHLYPVRITSGTGRIGRDDLLHGLRDQGIGANVHYELIYRFSIYRELLGDLTGSCPTAEQAADTLLSLPMFHGMSPENQRHVVETTKNLSR